MALFSEEASYFIYDPLYTQIIRVINNQILSKEEIFLQIESRLGENRKEVVLADLIKKGVLLTHANQCGSTLQNLHLDNLTKQTVSLLSYSDVPVGLLQQTLHALGFNVTENGNFHILVVNDYLDVRIKQFYEESHLLKRPWCLIKPKGKCVWVGPIFNTAEKNPYINWELITTRIKENIHAKVDLLGFESDKLALQTTPYLPTNAAIAFNVAGTEIAKWLLTKNSSLSDAIFTYDSSSLETKLHQVSPFLYILPQKDPLSSIPLLQKSKKYFFDDFGERACAPETTYEKIKQLNSPITGFVSKSYYRKEGDFHIFYGARSLFCSDKHKITIPPRHPEIVVGKHKNKLSAEIGFIAEAVERYFSLDLNLHAKRYAPYHDIIDQAIHPYSLLNYSSYQYLQRKELNINTTSFQWIPTPFNEETPISWLLLKGLNSNTQRYIPASYCYMNYAVEREFQMCPGDSNGAASGNTVEEALFYAILEITERDAMAIWWYNRLRRPSINLSTIDSPLVKNVISQLTQLDRVLRVIDITTDINIPVFVAVSWKKDGSQITLGSGAHLDPLIAIHRAIAEHNQILTRTNDLNTPLSKLLPNEKDLVHWLTHENIQSHAFICEEKGKHKTLDIYEKKASDDFYVDIKTCLQEFEKSKLDVFWLPLTPPDFPLKVVKVIIPGMRMFWKRLGKGRLYDVPVLLKDFSIALEEKELNPIGYFV